MTATDMADGGSVDSGRPETPDTDESSEVSILYLYHLIDIIYFLINFNLVIVGSVAGRSAGV